MTLKECRRQQAVEMSNLWMLEPWRRVGKAKEAKGHMAKTPKERKENTTKERVERKESRESRKDLAVDASKAIAATATSMATRRQIVRHGKETVRPKEKEVPQDQWRMPLLQLELEVPVQRAVQLSTTTWEMKFRRGGCSDHQKT